MGWLTDLASEGLDYIKDNKGQIISGVAGAVLGNEGGGKKTTGQTVNSMPPWMTDYAQKMLQQSASIASRPYEEYAGPRVAGLTQDQEDAANMVRQNAGQASGVIADAMGRIDPNAGQSNLAKAGQYLDQAGGSWLDPGVSEGYMADYRANVTDPSTSQAMRNWNEEINPSIQGTFAGNKGVGAYGSSAMLKNMTAAGSRLSEVLADNMAKYNASGYTGGMNQFNQQNQQRGQLSQIASGLGQTEQQMNAAGSNNLASLAERYSAQTGKEASALSNVGENQRQLNQAAMDVDFQNWAKSQGYSQAQLDSMLATLKGVQGATGSSSTTSGLTKEDSSPLKNAATGISLYNTITGQKDPAPVTPVGNGGIPTGWVPPPNDPIQFSRGGMLRRIRRAA